MLANHVYAHLLLFLQPSVLWFSTFNNYVKPPGAKVNFARIWCITNPTPTSLGYLTLKRWHGKIWPQLRGLPSVTDRLPTFKGHPTDHVNVIKLKWEIIWTGGQPGPLSTVSAVKPLTIYHLSQSCTTWVSLLRLDKLLLFLDMSAAVPNVEASW